MAGVLIQKHSNKGRLADEKSTGQARDYTATCPVRDLPSDHGEAAFCKTLFTAQTRPSNLPETPPKRLQGEPQGTELSSPLLSKLIQPWGFPCLPSEPRSCSNRHPGLTEPKPDRTSPSKPLCPAGLISEAGALTAHLPSRPGRATASQGTSAATSNLHSQASKGSPPPCGVGSSLSGPASQALSILNPTLPPNPLLQSCHPEILSGPQKAKLVPCSARNALP